jgi:hypothetical protein
LASKPKSSESKHVLILGIKSSCDETAAAVLRDAGAFFPMSSDSKWLFTRSTVVSARTGFAASSGEHHSHRECRFQEAGVTQEQSAELP